jgi:hypothetical protein
MTTEQFKNLLVALLFERHEYPSSDALLQEIHKANQIPTSGSYSRDEAFDELSGKASLRDLNGFPSEYVEAYDQITRLCAAHAKRLQAQQSILQRVAAMQIWDGVLHPNCDVMDLIQTARDLQQSGAQ